MAEKGGHKGCERRAGPHGHEFYEETGQGGGEKGGPKGGLRVKELIEEGKEAESRNE